MTNCYRIEKIEYEKGLFDSAIDATFIIHLENNSRYEHIMNQLQKIKPTKNVYILYNKGYKNCKKQDYIKNTNQDLVDANLMIFKFAKELNFNNILILEDDFIFNDKLNEQTGINKINEICNFLNKNIKQDFQYLIGCLPLILMPYNLNHYLVILSIGLHSCVYSKKNRENILNINQEKIKDMDIYNNLYFRRYTYYEPLCYQLFPITENSKTWGLDYNLYYLSNIFKIFLKFIQLDKQIEPGYPFFYIFSKLSLFLLFLFLFILHWSFTATTTSTCN
jgi:hypothetical protein